MKDKQKINSCDYVVVNENLEICVEKIMNIIKSERSKKTRLIDLTKFINKFRV